MNRREFIKTVLRLSGVVGLIRMGLYEEAKADGLVIGWPAVGGSTTLINWTAENTYNDGVSGTWTNSAEGSFNSAAPLSGTYSAELTQSQDAGFENFQSPNMSYTAGATVYGRCIVRFLTALPAYTGAFLGLYDSGASEIFTIRRFTDHTRVYNGTANTENYSIVIALATTYYVWWDYTPGTGANGVSHAYIGTTGTKGSATSITVTTGTAQTDVQNLRLLSLYQSGGGSILFDECRMDTVDPGDF